MIEDDLKAFIPRVAPSAYSNMTAMENTATLVSEVLTAGIHGDLVECGVCAGVHCAIMAKAVELSWQIGRRVHLFDSFQGIPEAGPRDDQWPGIGPRPGVEKTGRLISTGISACARDDVQRNMMRWGVYPDILVYHEGWFQETLPALRPGELTTIALLRLDADLYESTKVCLEYLYDMVVPGGVVIVDDWLLPGCRDAVAEFFGGALPAHAIEPGGFPMWWRKA